MESLEGVSFDPPALLPRHGQDYEIGGLPGTQKTRLFHKPQRFIKAQGLFVVGINKANHLVDLQLLKLPRQMNPITAVW